MIVAIVVLGHMLITVGAIDRFVALVSGGVVLLLQVVHVGFGHHLGFFRFFFFFWFFLFFFFRLLVLCSLLLIHFVFDFFLDAKLASLWRGDFFSFYFLHDDFSNT